MNTHTQILTSGDRKRRGGVCVWTSEYRGRITTYVVAGGRMTPLELWRRERRPAQSRTWKWYGKRRPPECKSFAIKPV